MRLFFSVGEPSGDVHTAHWIREIRQRHPDWELTGFGGPEMAKAGCQVIYPLTDLAVVGIARVIPLLAKFWAVGQQAKRVFATERPDAVILVDFPGFNWWIARFAKAAGIPVYYYLPPQIWAWASHRVERMKRLVDRVFCCLPFEPNWYAERGVHAEYVGHPIFDELAAHPLDADFLEQQRRDNQPIVAVLPGSRRQEVTANFPVQLDVIERLHQRHPEVRFLVANYREDQRHWCAEQLRQRGKSLNVELYTGRTSEIIDVAQMCLSVSGSVSLELLARAKPTVIMYRVGHFLRWFCQNLFEVGYVSLPNLFADRMLMPEMLITGKPLPYTIQIVDILSWWLSEPAERAHVAGRLEELRDRVVVRDALTRAADALLAELDGHSTANAA